MRSALRATVVGALLLLGAIWPDSGSAAPAAPAEDLSAGAWRVLELTNQEREKAGLSWLKWNDLLAATATDYAGDLVARNYFSHTSKEGTMPWDRAKEHGYPTYGWGGAYVGENLAQGFASPEEAVKAWMNSPGHRANLLKREYRELGVGVVVDATGRKTWVQNFGSRPGVLTVVINGEATTTDSPEVALSVTSEEVSSWGSMGKPVQMMVSNRPDFADALWEPYTGSRAWTLVNEAGLERVYLRLKDGRGTVVEASDEIRLTRQQPAGLAQVAGLSLPATSPAVLLPQSQQAPEFRLGFKALADLIPELVYLGVFVSS